NDGTGNFTNRFAGSGIPVIAKMSSVIVADYDSDGDLDIYLGNWELPNVLMRNDGGFNFTDVSVAAGVADVGAAVGCAWGDFDNDSHVDLYVANRGGSSGNPITQRLYRNQGDGTFVDVAVALGVNYTIPLYQAVFVDFDLDGDADLYLSGDKCAAHGEPNRLYRNDGGTFTDISVGSGADVCIGSMGVAIGDLNFDGWPDMYCTDVPPDNVMLLNQGGNGTFVDDAIASGLASNAIGWAAIFFDYDNDTREDLYVCNSSDVNRLYDNDGVWPIPDVAAALQVNDPGSSFGAAVGDIDGDGDLDLLVSDNGDRVRLFINHEGENRNWIKFHVRGYGESYAAIGANVQINVGSTSQRKEVIAGGNGFKGQNELILHFGLDTAQTVDEAVITWPGGHTRTLTNLVANRTYKVHPAGDIPTLSAWGLVMMAMGIVVLGTLVVRYRVVFPANASSAR
ncbi:MAG: VCBS repeat-containing protein, partial [Planctomycetes bacterium]|nr:VCBS repeat-containing protein [Planctomycetota bacterium]